MGDATGNAMTWRPMLCSKLHALPKLTFIFATSLPSIKHRHFILIRCRTRSILNIHATSTQPTRMQVYVFSTVVQCSVAFESWQCTYKVIVKVDPVRGA